MRITKKTIWQMDFPYAVCAYEHEGKRRVVCATETAGCAEDFTSDGEHIGTLWTEPGGTMTVCHMGNENFLATNRFFKRFQSQDAVVSAVVKNGEGGWTRTEVLKLPYLHRFCVVESGGERWLVGGTLCDRKDSFEDWSQAGGIYVGRIPEKLDEPIEVRCIYHGIHKNHGLYCGKLNGRDVVICTGVEGAFRVDVHEEPDGEWKAERILDCEISDIRVFDLDGDGYDELVTIEGFHGDRMRIYKWSDGKYEKVYEYPIAFGHALWCGNMLGERTVLMGYKNANGALLAMRFRPGAQWTSDITVIDEMEQCANLDVHDAGDKFYIYAACSVGNFNMYTLEKD